MADNRESSIRITHLSTGVDRYLQPPFPYKVFLCRVLEVLLGSPFAEVFILNGTRRLYSYLVQYFGENISHNFEVRAGLFKDIHTTVSPCATEDVSKSTSRRTNRFLSAHFCPKSHYNTTRSH
uniref:Uncharacterized protein n=1 Tax=Tetranychus urticae TaxID=32264 RepID=T1JQW2_TETUR